MSPRPVRSVRDLRWAASPYGSHAHLMDEQSEDTSLCSRTVLDPEFHYGHLPVERWPGYMICPYCPQQLGVLEQEVADLRRPLTWDELPSAGSIPWGRHAMERETITMPRVVTLDRRSSAADASVPRGGVPGRWSRPGTPAAEPTAPPRRRVA